MLGNFTKEEIEKAREFLAGIKATKFAVNAPKHQCDNLEWHDIRRHLLSEVQEFQDIAYAAHSGYGLERQFEELADISNCVDILVMILLRKREPIPLSEIQSLFGDGV